VSWSFFLDHRPLVLLGVPAYNNSLNFITTQNLSTSQKSKIPERAAENKNKKEGLPRSPNKEPQH
jgi:hypothetical protein